jgi:hypothetical protein
MIKDVDEVTAESHQSRVFARHIQWDRSDLEADANSGLLAVLFVASCSRRWSPAARAGVIPPRDPTASNAVSTAAVAAAMINRLTFM